MARKAIENGRGCLFRDESAEGLRDCMRPREFVEALLKNKQYQVVIDFLAYALPVRVAIWWGCLCLQHVGGNGPSGAKRAANTATVYWGFRPTENDRVAAKIRRERRDQVRPPALSLWR